MCVCKHVSKLLVQLHEVLIATKFILRTSKPFVESLNTLAFNLHSESHFCYPKDQLLKISKLV